MGVVQDLGYIATFPLLLNIAGEPTYFIPLKDNTNLVKSYAMVNVARYDIVATGSSVTQCEQEYIRMLSDKGVTQPEELPQTTASGSVAEIRSAVLEATPIISSGWNRRASSTPSPPPEPPGGDPEPWRPGDHHPCRLRHPRLHPGRLHPDGGRQAQSQASLPTPQEDGASS